MTDEDASQYSASEILTLKATNQSNNLYKIIYRSNVKSGSSRPFGNLY